MKKEHGEKQLPSTPGNAKHKSRQVNKKSGDTFASSKQDNK